MYKVVENAPAKINLFLEVTGKREDGYHSIESIMSCARLSDEVILEKNESGKITVGCILEKEGYPLSELDEQDNLAYKAANLFFSSYETKKGADPFGVHITILKRIPVCAGLGGGSTDAAATLRGLNTLCKKPFTQAELCEMGAKLGADVPFCVVGGTCLCRGIGEELTAVKTDMTLSGLVCLERKPKESTGAAYKKIDSLQSREIRTAKKAVSALETGDLLSLCKELYNVFEIACDYGNTASVIMKQKGALGVLLSGAGPSVFGLFADEKSKTAARLSLEDEGFTVYDI